MRKKPNQYVLAFIIAATIGTIANLSLLAYMIWLYLN